MPNKTCPKILQKNNARAQNVKLIMEERKRSHTSPTQREARRQTAPTPGRCDEEQGSRAGELGRGHPHVQL